MATTTNSLSPLECVMHVIIERSPFLDDAALTTIRNMTRTVIAARMNNAQNPLQEGDQAARDITHMILSQNPFADIVSILIGIRETEQRKR